MKLQRTTIILVGMALLLGAGVLISESQRSRSTADADLNQPAGPPILDFAETDVASLTVERHGETLQFQRNGQDAWQMVKPETGPAEAGAIAFLLSRLNTDEPLRKMTLTPAQQAEFGLEDPTGTVTVTLEDGSQHTLVLGAKDFSGNALYALVDPAQVPLPETSEAVPLYLVSLDVANGVERPLAEWKAATATPTASTPTSSETPTDSPDGSPPPSEAATDDPIEVPPQEAPPDSPSPPPENPSSR